MAYNNKYSVVHKGLNMVFVVFSLVVMGGAAFAMTTMNFNYKSSAANAIVTATGNIVKTGTTDFTKCAEYIRLNNLSATTIKYGLLNATTTATVPGVSYNATVPCLPLSIQASYADPFLGKKVTVTGTYTNKVFFANKIRLFGVACTEQCPGSDGVLRNCSPPESDGTADESLCNFRGRVETCGGARYCCPAVGARWTTDMTVCGTATPQP